MAERVGNQELVRLHARTGWSRKELARRVNQRATLRGVALHTDATRIRHWLEGQHPQSPVPELLSELLSEELGYPILPADLGFDSAHELDIGLHYRESVAATVVVLAELGRYAMRRRGFLGRGMYLAVATLAPSQEWLLAVLDATEPRPVSKIGEHQVSIIREAFADFLEVSVMRGGGYARRALTEYIMGRVLPMLDGVDPDSEIGGTLFGAAAEQVYLLAYMALDDGRQALGQRYFIQGLRLAQASGDVALGAQILAGMGEQALLLGYAKDALRLAKAGRHGLTRAPSPACAADLWALQSRAHAVLGDSRAAAHAVIESERNFEHIVPENEPEWARFIDEANLSCHWAETFVILRQPKEGCGFARRAISAAAAQKRARRGALSEAALARAALIRHDVEAALHAAHRVVDLSATLRSSRCIGVVRDLRSRISPYHSVSAARDFDDRAQEFLSSVTPA